MYSEEIDDRGDDGDSDDDTEEAIGAANTGKFTKYCLIHINYDSFLLMNIPAQPTQQNDNNFDEAAMEEDDDDNSGGSSGGDDLAEEGFHSKCAVLIGRKL